MWAIVRVELVRRYGVSMEYIVYYMFGIRYLMVLLCVISVIKIFYQIS